MTACVAELEHHRRSAAANLAIEPVDTIEQALLDRIRDALGDLAGVASGEQRRLVVTELRIATDLLNARRHARRTFAPVDLHACA